MSSAHPCDAQKDLNAFGLLHFKNIGLSKLKFIFLVIITRLEVLTQVGHVLKSKNFIIDLKVSQSEYRDFELPFVTIFKISGLLEPAENKSKILQNSCQQSWK